MVQAGHIHGFNPTIGAKEPRNCHHIAVGNTGGFAVGQGVKYTGRSAGSAGVIFREVIDRKFGIIPIVTNQVAVDGERKRFRNLRKRKRPGQLGSQAAAGRLRQVRQSGEFVNTVIGAGIGCRIG